ncbi:MAG: histidine phosphatase family protein [Minisyncoccales bacterium]
MPKLILVRHLQSQWNLENRFTGWVDVPLSRVGLRETKKVAQQLKGKKIDVIYTSPLIRNKMTVLKILENLDKKKYPLFIHLKGRMKEWGHFHKINKNYWPVYVSESLNERYYGQLQGLNKAQMMKKYGQEKVQLWRRSFTVRPPGGESLKDTYQRVIPFYRQYIEKDLKKGKNVLVVASHNSLRALVKYLEKVPDEAIPQLEIPYAGMRKYDFPI